METKSEGLQGREILIIIPRSSAAIECVITTFDSQSCIKDMRRRDSEIAKGWGQIATPLSVQTSDIMEATFDWKVEVIICNK